LEAPETAKAFTILVAQGLYSLKAICLALVLLSKLVLVTFVCCKLSFDSVYFSFNCAMIKLSLLGL